MSRAQRHPLFWPTLSGINSLAENYDSFHSGLVYFTQGVSALEKNYDSINSGIYGLAGGVNELDSAVGSLNDGTSRLSGETAGMPDKIDDKIDELLGESTSRF